MVTANGEKILLMAPDIVEALGEATIDVEDTEKGRRVIISRCTGVSRGSIS
ncbi:MAG: hypothetical protein JSU97_08060 [Dehalococcoidia bacterium]|nr:MAG: hypothetical protein JSU97_08060 [Dehalococcoidia bacterium]